MENKEELENNNESTEVKAEETPTVETTEETVEEVKE
jgi:hypothetical protein